MELNTRELNIIRPEELVQGAYDLPEFKYQLETHHQRRIIVLPRCESKRERERREKRQLIIVHWGKVAFLLLNKKKRKFLDAEKNVT